MIPTTPNQTIGPFFHFIVEPGSELVVPEDDPAAIRLEGRVTDGDGNPVNDAMIELWQADRAGRYPHPDDPRRDECDPAFTGFARTATDEDGRYRFVTVVPGPVPSPDGGEQAPHIALGVFARGLMSRLVTRAYLPVDGAALAADPVLAALDEDRRATLIATAAGDRFVFDIRLQGDGETVFFDV